MLEVLKICANWGFPAVLCIYLLSVLPKFGKTLDRLDIAIENHLTHALEGNTEATKQNSASTDKVEVAIIGQTKSINEMCLKLTGFIEKK